MLAGRSGGFWGVDNSGDGDRISGIRRGAGGEESAPAEARTAAGVEIFLAGDRVGLLVDMDARTLTMFLNGRLIPGLVLGGLPDLVYICATPFNDDASATILPSASLPEGMSSSPSSPFARATSE